MKQSPPQIDSFTLQGLLDVPLPEPVSFLPQTLGWQLLGVVLLLLMGGLMGRRLQRAWQQRYRHEGLAALERAASLPWAEQVLAVQHVLKTVAIYAYPERDLAALSGPAWLDFLAQTGGADWGASGLAWQQALFLPRSRWTLSEADMAQVRVLARQWLTQHGGGEHA